MKYSMTIPASLGEMPVKQLLEEEFLIPRKIRHFLRTKKHVWVNDQPIHWQSLIKAGDRITLEFDSEDYPAKSIPWGDPNLVDVLFEDSHLIVVNKPEGMKTHGNEPSEIALLNHVTAHCEQTCYVVHRLDKETSGAVMFAKNPFVLPILNRLLEDKRVAREYWALLERALPKKQMVYKDKIGRDRHDRRKRLVDPRKGQYAETHVRELKRFGRRSLVACRLKTGRTHQIRVHMAHHGHPIVGDPLYNSARGPRLMLHAHRLTFTHPFTRETIQVDAHSQSFERGLVKYRK